MWAVYRVFAKRKEEGSRFFSGPLEPYSHVNAMIITLTLKEIQNHLSMLSKKKKEKESRHHRLVSLCTPQYDKLREFVRDGKYFLKN